MPVANLLKSQSNEVYLALVEAGWDISVFEWAEVKSPNYSKSNLTSAKLEHKSSKFYFIFDNHGQFWCEHSPDNEVIKFRGDCGTWSNQISRFKIWLDYLSREVNVPDLWEELPSDSKLIETTSEETDNSKFTAEEKKEIRNGLEEIKQYLIDAHKLDPELIDGQLKYLADSANRLGRKDWKNILISTIFSIIIQGGIAGHSAQEIFQFVWTVLQTVLIHKVYLP